MEFSEIFFSEITQNHIDISTHTVYRTLNPRPVEILERSKTVFLHIITPIIFILVTSIHSHVNLTFHRAIVTFWCIFECKLAFQARRGQSLRPNLNNPTKLRLNMNSNVTFDKGRRYFFSSIQIPCKLD